MGLTWTPRPYTDSHGARVTPEARPAGAWAVLLAMVLVAGSFALGRASDEHDHDATEARLRATAVECRASRVSELRAWNRAIGLALPIMRRAESRSRAAVLEHPYWRTDR